MEKFKISVVTVVYNSENEIEQTIKSVIRQDYANKEYIVIDGGSTDGTVDIINKYLNNINYFISEKDHGIYDAMNKAIQYASGTWINFMNSGDQFIADNVLSNIHFDKLSKYDVIFGDQVIRRFGTLYVSEAKPLYESPYCKHSMGFNHQCCFVKRSCTIKYPFDLRYKLAADYDMIMKIFRNGGFFLHVSLPIAYFDLNGVSSLNQAKHRKEVLMIDGERGFSLFFQIVCYRLELLFRKYVSIVLCHFFPTIKKERTIKNLIEYKGAL